MPTREAIVNTVLPQEIIKPIPVRTVSTKGNRIKPTIAGAPADKIGNQPHKDVSNPAAASAPTEESVRLSPQLSALARKEQAFRQREQAFKAKEAEYLAFKEKAEKFDQLSSKMGAKDFSEAEKLGLNYDEYTKYKLAQSDGEDPTLQKIASLEQQLADLKKGQEENDTQSFEELKKEYRKEIATAVSSNPEFSSIKELGEEAQKAVLTLILDSFEEDSLELTVEQACKDVETALVEQGKKYSSLTKLKPAPAAEDVQLPPPRTSASTLTNNMLPPSGNQGPQKSLQHLSEAERYAEARRRVLARRAQQQGT